MLNTGLKTKKQQQSDVKRLATLKQRQNEKISQLKLISESLKNLDNSLPSRKRIKFDFDDETDLPSIVETKTLPDTVKGENNLNLFESSESEEDEDDDKRFSIKQQFEGEKGQELLEKSSGISDERFKLDVRFLDERNTVFKEDESSDDLDDKASPDDINEPSAAAEKDRHLSILEDVLGFQVPKRAPESHSAKQKKYIRFDPESESAEQFIQKTEEEITKTSKKKQTKEAEVQETEPVVSKERYFEIVPDLKEVLSSSNAPFSLSQKFNLYEAWEDFSHHDDALDAGQLQTETRNSECAQVTSAEAKCAEPNEINDSLKLTESKVIKDKFFFDSDDSRLIEGIEFFRRTKPMDEVRKEWLSTRDVIVDMYRRNRRLTLKSSSGPVRNQRRFRGRQHFQR